MDVRALTTGTATLKRSFLHPRPGRLRRLGLLLPSPWSDPMPIHAWVIEHDGRRFLVDTGGTQATADLPFVTFAIDRELPDALQEHGLAVGDLDEVVLTHLHGDHMDGVAHVPRGTPVRVHAEELQLATSPAGRLQQRLTRAPLPQRTLSPFVLDDGPFGGFPTSKRLTDDGRMRAVGTPGHTPHHISVLAIDDDGRHLLLAGDVTDTLEQLHARRADAVAPDAAEQVLTHERVLAHARMHPTVYLPSHDPESVARLTARTAI